MLIVIYLGSNLTFDYVLSTLCLFSPNFFSYFQIFYFSSIHVCLEYIQFIITIFAMIQNIHISEHIYFGIVTTFVMFTFQTTTCILKLAKDSKHLVLSTDKKRAQNTSIPFLTSELIQYYSYYMCIHTNTYKIYLCTYLKLHKLFYLYDFF